VLLPLN
jgi:hypothetical protein